jgi:hypothetical protein
VITRILSMLRLRVSLPSDEARLRSSRPLSFPFRGLVVFAVSLGIQHEQMNVKKS